jgi:hypothetical protein
VRIRVTAGTQRELKRAEVRMISTGGAAAEGTTRSALGTLRAGRAASADFAVRLPDQGRRFLLEFRVSGEGAGGLESRGGVLNLLPDGPADPGRLVSSASGATVVEYRARRIGR